MSIEVVSFGEHEKTPGAVKTMIVSCDHAGCQEKPQQEEIFAAGGLQKMGWYALGGKHYCPAHRGEYTRG